MPGVVELLIVGALAGALGGMLGAGGGFATVVLLVALGVDPHEAVGTSLVYAVAIGTWGTLVHLRQRSALPRLALALGVPAALTALAGAEVGRALSDEVLTLAFGSLTAAVAVAILFDTARKARSVRGAGRRNVLPVSGAQTAAPPVPRLGRRELAAATAGGAGIGFAQGLFGVGGGFLFVPLMLIGLRVPERLAAGTSLFALVIGGVSGSVRHLTLGQVDGSLLVYLLPAGVVGGFLGARASVKLSPAFLRAAFLVVMLGSAGYLLARGF